MSYTLNLLIKIGAKEHIDKLQSKGLIHSKTVKYFRDREIKEAKQRGDTREGAQESKTIRDLGLFVDNKKLPLKFTKSRLNTFDSNLDLTHIFCLYGVTPEFVNGRPFIDPKVVNFGDTALIITNPGEFINRIEKRVKDEFKCAYGPVKYYPDSEDYSELTVFDKPDSFSFQREFRFHFHYLSEEALEFKIGSIKDISYKIESKKIPSLILKREQ